jgi:DNA replication licensing factor MCM4
MVEQFREFSLSGGVYEKLVASFAPSIWELDDVKKGVLCQLFGGRAYEDDDEQNEGAGQNGKDIPKRLKPRGDFHVLLCGDPGTSKSQLLSFVHKIAPRGIFTSGKADNRKAQQFDTHVKHRQRQ